MPAVHVTFVAFGVSIIWAAVVGIKMIVEVISQNSHGTKETIRFVALDTNCVGQKIDWCAVTITADIIFSCFSFGQLPHCYNERERQHHYEKFFHINHLTLKLV